jgi:hypothetical protein
MLGAMALTTGLLWFVVILVFFNHELFDSTALFWAGTILLGASLIFASIGLYAAIAQSAGGAIALFGVLVTMAALSTFLGMVMISIVQEDRVKAARKQARQTRVNQEAPISIGGGWSS